MVDLEKRRQAWQEGAEKALGGRSAYQAALVRLVKENKWTIAEARTRLICDFYLFPTWDNRRTKART